MDVGQRTAGIVEVNQGRGSSDQPRAARGGRTSHTFPIAVDLISGDQPAGAPICPRFSASGRRYQSCGGGQHGVDDLGHGRRPKGGVAHGWVEPGIQDYQDRANRHACGEVVVLVEVGGQPLLVEQLAECSELRRRARSEPAVLAVPPPRNTAGSCCGHGQGRRAPDTRSSGAFVGVYRSDWLLHRFSFPTHPSKAADLLENCDVLAVPSILQSTPTK